MLMCNPPCHSQCKHAEIVHACGTHALAKLLLVCADITRAKKALIELVKRIRSSECTSAKSMQGRCTFHAGDVLRHAITPQEASKLHLALPAPNTSLSQQH